MTIKDFSTLLSDSSWNTAKSLVTGIGNFNNSLTQVTKVLERQKSDTDEVDQTCYFMMRTLLANHHFRAKIYYALLTLHSAEYDTNSSFTAKQLIKKFKKSEHSAIAAAIFIYSLARSAAAPEHQPEIDKNIQEYGEVGLLAAQSISQVAAPKGLILGMIRHAAFAVFSKHKTESFTKYRSHLNKNKLPYDLQYEAEAFGCQYPQIASLITQKVGFTRDFSQNCYLALATDIQDNAIPTVSRAYRETTRLIDYIMLCEDIPTEADLNYSNLGHERASILDSLKQALKIRSTGSQHAWLSQSTSNISAANNPDLFEENPTNFFESDFDFGNIPAAIREAFSLEDFASFRKAVQEILEE